MSRISSLTCFFITKYLKLLFLLRGRPLPFRPNRKPSSIRGPTEQKVQRLKLATVSGVSSSNWTLNRPKPATTPTPRQSNPVRLTIHKLLGPLTPSWTLFWVTRLMSPDINTLIIDPYCGADRDGHVSICCQRPVLVWHQCSVLERIEFAALTSFCYLSTTMRLGQHLQPTTYNSGNKCKLHIGETQRCFPIYRCPFLYNVPPPPLEKEKKTFLLFLHPCFLL